MRQFAVIEAPSVLGHIPTHLGVGRLPGVLLGFGFAEQIGARRAGRVESPPWAPERDPETHLMNPDGLADYAVALADKVNEVSDRGEFPVVLGGDCSILLGTMLALKRRGRFGELHIDGHPDFYQPANNPIRGAASASELALVTGRGPDLVVNIEGRKPLVRDEDIAVLGYRDGVQQVRNRSQPIPAETLAIDREMTHRMGLRTAAELAVAHLTRDGGPEGYWIHVDADVLDQSIMSACDDPRADGFSWEELHTAISVAMASPRAVGLQLTIYNPDMDGDGSSGRGLSATVAGALAGSNRAAG